MAAITDEIKESFKNGSALTKLIYINLAVFIVVKLFYVFFFLLNSSQGALHEKSIYFQQFYLTYLMLPANLIGLLHKPWTLLSYMFLHFDFLHILFNMLWLFWFGRIFLKYLTERQIISTYLLGGFSGAALYLLAYNIFPGLLQDAPFAQVLGASASVTAIVMAISFYSPDYTIYLPLIGPVKIKYIALFFIVLDLLQIASDNAGGHITHLGGALYGYFFALQMKQGKDAGKFFGKAMDFFVTVFKKNRRMKVSYKSNANRMDDLEYNKAKVENQKEVDRILDKIAKSGYESLSKKEKETLFKMSNQS